MRKTLRVLFVITFCLLLVGGGVGCTRNRTRTRVSGLVTVDGQPAKVGRVTFTPVGGGKTYSDTIFNGRYAVRSRYSMPPGEYTVRVETSSTGSSRGGYDRQMTDKVAIGGFGRDTYDFYTSRGQE
jgi:hypothetical protein